MGGLIARLNELTSAQREAFVATLGEADRLALRGELCEASLAEFARAAWPNVDITPYTHGWYVDAASEHLEAVSAGEIDKLLVTMPPGLLKSILFTVIWPAWEWTRLVDVDPETGEPAYRGASTRFLWTAYHNDLATRDSVRCRRLIDSAWYQLLWGERSTLTTDQNTKTRFENDRGGRRIATSAEGLGTGERGDVVGVDDAHNVTEVESETEREKTVRWWFETMSTRVNPRPVGVEPRHAPRAHIAVNQRTHSHDVAGEAIDRGTYWHLCLPMRYEPDHPYAYAHDPRTEEGELLAPNLYPEQKVAALEVELGSYATASQLQQHPGPRKGGLFDADNFRVIDEAELPANLPAVRGWDLGATDESEGGDPAWSAGVKLSRDRAGHFYVEDVRRERVGPFKLEKLIRGTAEADGKRVKISLPQDPGGAGKFQARYLVSKLAGYTVRATPESGSKVTRAEPVSTQVEAKNVYLVNGPWVRKFLDEAQLFPNSKFKDQVDALSRAFEALLSRPVGVSLGSQDDLTQESAWGAAG